MFDSDLSALLLLLLRSLSDGVSSLVGCAPFDDFPGLTSYLFVLQAFFCFKKNICVCAIVAQFCSLSLVISHPSAGPHKDLSSVSYKVFASIFSNIFERLSIQTAVSVPLVHRVINSR